VVDKRHAYVSCEKKSKKEVKWMSNGWSKVTIQKKFSKYIDFILFGIAMYLG
jgi:hypothetical protein